MNLSEIISQLIIDTRGNTSDGAWFAADSSLGMFCPELWLCVIIVAMLFIRVFSWGRRVDMFWVALLGSGAALYYALVKTPAVDGRVEIFTGMLVYDTFTIYIRAILLLFLVLFIAFTKLSGIPDKEDSPDIYTLVLGSTLGMCLMASANHLIMVFMAIEMASVPSYVLAGMLKGRKQGSEAALKYSIYGAGAAGVMLYGISLVVGMVNTAHLPSVAEQLATRLPDMASGELMTLAIGGVMISVGLAFKLSAVPFHFWCPDVFEGASAEVNAFLSVASKAAALALLVRVTIGLGTVPPESTRPGQAVAQQQQTEVELAAAPKGVGQFAVKDDEVKKDNDHVDGEKHDDHAHGDHAHGDHDHDGGGHAPGDHDGDDHDHAGHERPSTAALGLAQGFIGKLIGFLALITCTFGNLAAYGQTNIKRLLAYSTIAHAGYMMMAIPPVMAMAATNPDGAEQAVAGLSIYIVTYLFMNLGVFAVVAFLRNAMRSEEIADYAGLIRHCPMVVVAFALMLFSLVGLPPLAGFIGKFAIFASLANAYRESSQGYLLLLLVAGGVNTAISLFYYLRVVKVMTMEPDSETRGPVSLPYLPQIYVFLLAIPTLTMIVWWNVVGEWAVAAARQLLG